MEWEGQATKLHREEGVLLALHTNHSTCFTCFEFFCLSWSWRAALLLGRQLTCSQISAQTSCYFGFVWKLGFLFRFLNNAFCVGTIRALHTMLLALLKQKSQSSHISAQLFSLPQNPNGLDKCRDGFANCSYDRGKEVQCSAAKLLLCYVRNWTSGLLHPNSLWAVSSETVNGLPIISCVSVNATHHASALKHRK